MIDWLGDATDRDISWAALGLAGAAAVGAIEGLLIEPSRLEVRRHRLEVPSLPEHLDGWTIAHVTDLHLGGVRGAHRKLLRVLEDVEPELTLCTGDLVERAEDLDTFERYARRLVAASDRIVSVWGNWEWRSGENSVESVRQRYERVGIPVLSNEWRTFDDVAIAGGDEPITGHFDPETLFESVPHAAVRLFLIHAPCVLDRAPANAPHFDLVLSGHTHGGQVRLGSFAPVTPPGSGRFVDGFYETAYGRTYVARGVGMTRLRVRLMCLPELPLFELRRAETNS